MDNKEAIKRLKWVKKRICDITYSPESFEALDLAIKALEKRPKGEWITQEGYDGDEYYECSVCKDALVLMAGTPKENNYNYCPNCGADMRGGKE